MHSKWGWLTTLTLGALIGWNLPAAQAATEAEIRAALEASFNKIYVPAKGDSTAEVQPERLKARRQVFEREVLLNPQRFLQSLRNDATRSVAVQVVQKDLKDFLRWVAPERPKAIPAGSSGGASSADTAVVYIKVDPKCLVCVARQKELKDQALQGWGNRGFVPQEWSRSQLGARSLAGDGFKVLREVAESQGRRIVSWVEVKGGAVDEAHPEDSKTSIRLGIWAKPPYPEAVPDGTSDGAQPFLFDETLEVDSTESIEGGYGRLWVAGLTRMGAEVDLRAWSPLAGAGASSPTPTLAKGVTAGRIEGQSGEAVPAAPTLPKIPAVFFELKGAWNGAKYIRLRDRLAERVMTLGRLEDFYMSRGKIVLRLRTEKSAAEVVSELAGFPESAGMAGLVIRPVPSTENRIEVVQ